MPTDADAIQDIEEAIRAHLRCREQHLAEQERLRIAAAEQHIAEINARADEADRLRIVAEQRLRELEECWRQIEALRSSAQLQTPEGRERLADMLVALKQKLAGARTAVQ